MHIRRKYKEHNGSGRTRQSGGQSPSCFLMCRNSFTRARACAHTIYIIRKKNLLYIYINLNYLLLVSFPLKGIGKNN